MIIIFDLDDTLYEEMTFVKGGIRAVSSFLENHIQEKSELIYSDLMQILIKHGRGKIFDYFLKTRNVFSKKLVLKCINIFLKNLSNFSEFTL